MNARTCNIKCNINNFIESSHGLVARKDDLHAVSLEYRSACCINTYLKKYKEAENTPEDNENTGI